MKKSFSNVLASVVLFISLSLIIALVLVEASSALDASEIENAASGAAEKVETVRGKIPTSADDVRNDYLTKEWSAVIAATPFIGPVHSFFLQQTLFFKLVFNTPYEFSLTFFCIVLLWLFVAYHAAKASAASGFIPRGGNIALGLCVTLLLAQLSLYNSLASASLSLLRSPENWVARIVISILLISLFVLAWYGSSFFEAYLKKRKKAAQEAKLQQNVAESSALLKGIREGQTARGNKTRRSSVI